MGNPALRGLLGRGRPVWIMGAHDVLSAKIIAAAGFDAIGVQSLQMAFVNGVPDIGVVGPEELVRVCRRIRHAVDLPIVVDFEQGFGEPYVCVYWMKELQAAGVSAIHIDDYGLPYKCPFIPPHVMGLEAWYAPMWIGEGPHTFMHMYATRFPGVREVADLLARKHDELLRRVLAWQQVVYSTETLPVWLRESLINILYLFPVNSFWAAARPPVGPWCRPEDGLFGLLDGIVEDPAIEPIPDTFYANAPLVYFFPDLALSTLRGYKAYQFADGAAVWIWGGVVGAAIGGYEITAGTEMAMPTPGYQTTTNGPCYVDMIDRYLQRTGDQSVFKEFYDSAKRNTIYTMQLNPEGGGDGIISVPKGNVDPENPSLPPGFHLEWFESVLWFGMTPHVGGIHLANLKMTERMAEAVGDKEFARQCRSWFEQGSRSMEKKLWTGSYYLTYKDEKLGNNQTTCLPISWMASGWRNFMACRACFSLTA